MLVEGSCAESQTLDERSVTSNLESACGMQDAADATMEVAKTLNEKVSKYCLVTIETCAYAGTGNVLKVAFCSHNRCKLGVLQ